VVRPKDIADDLPRPLEERLGLVVPPLGLEQDREVSEAYRGVGMVRAGLRLVDLQGPLAEWLGLVVLPLGREGDRQVVEAYRGVGVIRASSRFRDR